MDFTYVKMQFPIYCILFSLGPRLDGLEKSSIMGGLNSLHCDKYVFGW